MKSLTQMSSLLMAAALLGSWSSPLLAQDQSAEVEVALLAQQIEVLRLAPGTTTASASFLNERVTSVTLDLTALEAGVVATIETPTGAMIDAGNVGAFGGSFDSYEVTDATLEPGLGEIANAGLHSVFAFQADELGTYVLNLSLAVPSQEVPVIASWSESSALRAALLAPAAQLALGQDRAVINAFVVDGGTPVTGLTISATARSDMGQLAALGFDDDGMGDDQVAGDGVYTASFAPIGAGLFEVTARIEGNLPMQPTFRRDVATRFQVFASAASLTAGLTVTELDDNANSLIEAVRFETGASVNTAGSYLAQVLIAAPSGASFQHNAELSLALSDTQVRVDVPSQAFLALGEAGPYIVERFSLRYLDPTLGDAMQPRGQLVPSATLRQLVSTSALALSDLEVTALGLTGVVSDFPVDLDGDQSFDELQTNVEVFVSTAGSYEWSYKLTTPGLVEIDFAASSGLLVAGTNLLPLTFDGNAIGELGVNGPYRLRDLLLQGPTASPADSLIATELGATQPLNANQFAGFTGGPGGGGGGGGSGGGCSCNVSNESETQWEALIYALLLLGWVGLDGRRRG